MLDAVISIRALSLAHSTSAVLSAIKALRCIAVHLPIATGVFNATLEALLDSMCCATSDISNLAEGPVQLALLHDTAVRCAAKAQEVSILWTALLRRLSDQVASYDSEIRMMRIAELQSRVT